MKKISVIIPVYNVEKYLSKCIESVVNQKDCNLEIILVNDGSTDSSRNIIEEYVSKYDNVKCIDKENGGLSDARNEGIRHASGDYICFIDSDDYISDTLFTDIDKYVSQDYDMIKYKMIKVDEKYNEIEKIDGPVFENKTGKEAFNQLYSKDIMMDPAWLYLYKKSFWEENKFEYPHGKAHEDFALTALIMLKAKRVVSTGIYGYYYVQSSNSITRGNDEEKKLKRALDLFYHYDNMLDKIKTYEIDSKTKENLKIYYTNCMILKTEELSEASRKKYVEEIKKRKLYKNIKARNVKQFIKKILLKTNIDWYLKLR